LRLPWGKTRNSLKDTVQEALRQIYERDYAVIIIIKEDPFEAQYVDYK